MHVPAEVRHEHAAERVLRAQAEHEVGKVVEVARGGAGGTGELTVVRIAAVERVHVLHLRVNPLEFVSTLERMRLHRPGVVHFRVVDSRVLPLRIGRLPTEVGVTRDELRRKTARDTAVGGQTGQAERIERALAAKRRRVLAGLGPRIAEPHLQERRSTRYPRAPQDQLAVARVDVPVAGAAGRQRNVRLIVGGQIPKPVATEHRKGRARLQVDLAPGLVGISGELLQAAVVVRGAGNVRVGERRQDLARKGGHRDRGTGRIHDAGARVAHVDRHDALPLRRRGNGRKAGRLPRLAQALVVSEEERFVPHDRTANDSAELVPIELGFARRRLEESCRIHARIAEEVPAAAVQRVRAAPVVHVDRRSRGAAVFRAQVVRHDLELADGVR